MLKPWQTEEGWIPTVSAEVVWHREDVLDLYAAPEDPRRPRGCFDERPYQRVREREAGVPAQPGPPERPEYTYTREGTCNLFLVARPPIGWRPVAVTPRRTAQDVAPCLKDVVEVHGPDADLMRLVVDNRNTPTPAALYEPFRPEGAHRIARKRAFHYTPKHGRWLNLAESERRVVSSQCLDRRLPDIGTVRTKVAAWEAPRKATPTTITWRFTTPEARLKLKRLYPA